MLMHIAIGVFSVLLATGAAHGQQPTLFRFQSAFWMNLHHYLHALGRSTSPLTEELPADATAREREQWGRAVEFYRTRFGKRRLVFDDLLVTIKTELHRLGSSETLGDASLTPEHRQVLERAAPIYRRHWWAAHDGRNRKFIASIEARVARHGAAIAARLATSYDSAWPAGGLPVDVVRDAGPPGNAYTTNRPTHITVGAEDLGLMSLELMFHEASHGWDQQLMKITGDAARRLGVPEPPNLWHAILFYNAGRITKDELDAAGVSDYVLYMVDGKVFDAPGWHATIARHWSEFLAGHISRAEAAERILRDLK